MDQTTVRVRKTTHARIRGLAERGSVSMQAIIDRAIELLERQEFLERLNSAYAAVRADETMWSEVREERAAWDSALRDGLEDDDATSDAPTTTGA